ncbi:MAG: triose-phosphate isomerase [Nitrospinales bacterium]
MSNIRKYIVVANWKMNLLISESTSLVHNILDKYDPKGNVEVGLAPPFTALSNIKNQLSDTNLLLGGQNIYSEHHGAFTGEISAPMLKDVGCDFVILGHSERRIYFNEDDQFINRKVKIALESGLNIIFCIGESLEQYDKGETESIVKSQLINGLQGVSGSEMEKLIIAYEPIWAIGTGKNAEPDQAQSVHKYIRGVIGEIWDEDVSGKIQIQYGGSVNSDNSSEILSQDDIDGALIGGASLDAESFCAIINTI